MFDELIKMLSIFGDKSKDADKVKQQRLLSSSEQSLQIPYFRGEGKPGTLSVPSVSDLFGQIGGEYPSPVSEEDKQGSYQDVYDYLSKYNQMGWPNQMGNEMMAFFSALADAGIIDTSGTGGWGKDVPKNYWGKQHDYYSEYPEEYTPRFDVPYQLSKYTDKGFPVFQPYKPK